MSEIWHKNIKEGQKNNDFGSWRSIPAGSIKKSFMDSDSSSAEMIDGLLGIMPVGCRNVTYLPASAVETLSKEGSDVKDITSLPGVQVFSHGPYLDDWSKVPADIAAKYNTSPTFKLQK